MTNKRFVSLMIFIVAFAFIVYVVVDNYVGNKEGYLTNNTPDETFEPKDEVGLLRGMTAPNFTLPLWESSEERSLTDFRGNLVVLNLWASWCPPCRDEMPDLIELDEIYKDRGVKVVGINMGTLERTEGAMEKFMEEFDVQFPTFVDQSNDTINQRGIVESLYQVRALPATFILDKEGRIYSSMKGKVTFEMLENEIIKLLEQTEGET